MHRRQRATVRSSRLLSASQVESVKEGDLRAPAISVFDLSTIYLIDRGVCSATVPGPGSAMDSSLTKTRAAGEDRYTESGSLIASKSLSRLTL